jgi:hypothetical protein
MQGPCCPALAALGRGRFQLEIPDRLGANSFSFFLQPASLFPCAVAHRGRQLWALARDMHMHSDFVDALKKAASH